LVSGTIRHVPTPEEFAAMERYRARCLGLVIRLDGIVAPETLDQAHELIDHGEPGIAVEYLADGITRQMHKVPADVIRDLRDLAREPDQLPLNLGDFSET
jgi:hypothetical protein